MSGGRVGLVVAGWLLLAGCSGDQGADTTVRESTTTSSSSTTTSTSTSTTTTLPPEPEVCAVLEEVLRLSDEVAVQTNTFMVEALEAIKASEEGTMDDASLAALFEDYQRLFAEIDSMIPSLMEAYNRAIVFAPSDLKEDILNIRTASNVAWGVMADPVAEAESFEEMNRLMDEPVDPLTYELATGAGESVLRVDEFTMSECGFRLSS